MNTQEQDKLNSYHRAQDRVTELRGFYIHLVCFMIINPFLIYVNYATYWDYKWFWFSLLGWGIGVIAHALVIFGFGADWEKRKIEEIMEKENDVEFKNKR